MLDHETSHDPFAENNISFAVYEVMKSKIQYLFGAKYEIELGSE